MLAIFIVMFTTAFSNAFGVTVTKNVSSVARTILGSTRTLFVWIVELALRWEDFDSLELAGFVILVIGNLVYNSIIQLSFLNYEEFSSKKTSASNSKLSMSLMDERPRLPTGNIQMQSSFEKKNKGTLSF